MGLYEKIKKIKKTGKKFFRDIFLGITFYTAVSPLMLSAEIDKQKLFEVLPNVDSLQVQADTTLDGSVKITMYRLPSVPKQVIIECPDCDSIQQKEIEQYEEGAVFGIIKAFMADFRNLNNHVHKSPRWYLSLSWFYTYYISAMKCYEEGYYIDARKLFKVALRYVRLTKKQYYNQSLNPTEPILERLDSIETLVNQLMESTPMPCR